VRRTGFEWRRTRRVGKEESRRVAGLGDGQDIRQKGRKVGHVAAGHGGCDGGAEFSAVVQIIGDT